MRLEVLAVGRMKSGPERDLYERYKERIAKSGRALHLTGPHLTEISESRAGNPAARKQDEAHQLIACANVNTCLILLDEKGRDFSSRQFADFIQTEQHNGTSSISFAIGGPDGHGDAMKGKARQSVRLGAMTWPHQFARVMLLEQLYRAITILSGHPYHRE